VCLLTSIKQMTRRGGKDPEYLGNNAMEWTMHNLRLSLAAWVAAPRARGKRLTLYPLQQRARANRQVWLQAPVHLIHESLGD
jgi:hypothetical protein